MTGEGKIIFSSIINLLIVLIKFKLNCFIRHFDEFNWSLRTFGKFTTQTKTFLKENINFLFKINLT